VVFVQFLRVNISHVRHINARLMKLHDDGKKLGSMNAFCAIHKNIDIEECRKLKNHFTKREVDELDTNVPLEGVIENNNFPQVCNARLI